MSGRRRTRTVGIVGTFDVANFGDLLFPYLAEDALRRRLGPIDLRRYSIRPMAAPPWPYVVRPVEELLEHVQELELLIVGGGHLVRFDERVAPQYQATSAGIPIPTGFWLAPTLAAAAAGVPVAWNAPGVSSDTPAWARPLLALAVDAVSYASVRDVASLDELGRVAPSADVRLVPDSAFGVAAFLPSIEAPDPAASGPPYVLVQASAALRPYSERIAKAVTAATKAGRRVYELPVSPVLGDRIGTLVSLPEALPVDPWPDPPAIARLIAGAEAVVAASLHLTIVAVANGVPVLRAPAEADSKYAPLDALPGVTTIRPDTDVAAWLAARARGPVAAEVVGSASQVEAHWDRLAALVDSGPEQGAARRRAAGRMLAAIPGVIGAGPQDGPLTDAPAVNQDSVQLAKLADQVGALSQVVEHATAAAEAQRSAAEYMAKLEASMRAEADARQAVVDATRRAAEMAERVARLEGDLESERLLAATDRGRAQAEVRELKGKVGTARGAVAALRTEVRALRTLRKRRSVRVVLRISSAIRRARVRTLAILGMKPASRRARGSRTPLATAEQQRLLADALTAQAPGSPRVDGPLVSVIILNRNGRSHLRRLLPALVQATYRSFELIVVDNASTDGSREELARWTDRLALQVIVNDDNQSFSDGNNQAARVASGELLLFLNNDVEPLAPGWLGRLVDTIEAQDAVAVGARLVYPLRPERTTEADRRTPDLTLQHRGIHFIGADGIPTARNLGVADDALGQAAQHVGEAAGVTAACLLVRRAAFDAVGGYTPGYIYGTEDVDLNIKLRGNGGRLVYDGLAALWHHEYGTQNAEGQEWKRRNWARNRQLFVNRFGPQAFRTVLRDRLLLAGRWSEDPPHVAVTLTRDDPAAGWGDYYTAHEIGDALSALGWRVSYAERHRDRWYDLDPSVDIVLSLLDAFDIRQVKRGVVTIAWVRNWTERWIDHPWFDEYDIVLASSARSRDLVDANSAHRATLMPLATNPERFAPRPATAELRSDLLFVGNRWGEARAVETVLPDVGQTHRVRVFGTGWAGTDLEPFEEGPLAYDRLPDAYASAGLVMDDTAGPTLPYGAVNSRVFDALAAGALVVSDNELGVRELFGDEFPVARDAADVEATLRWMDEEPDAAASLRERLRTTVLDHHTYAHRAREIRDHLLGWVEADHYAILIGAPNWERALYWGDYHFARSLQRQLHRQGFPTRVHLLDEWNRSPAARADIVINLHGLSEYRPRQAQLNLLWVISHPDRVTPAVCERYDAVFVASDAFAEILAPQSRVPVIPLHQATDPERFFPEAGGPPHELLLVANTRGTRRAIVDDLVPTAHELAIYGLGWTDVLVDPAYVRGDHIPNRMLNRYYAAAGIVLNDHWPDMRSHGFISNRPYDALAAGAFVISDAAAGLTEEFEGAVETYTTRTELRDKVDAFMADPDARKERAARGRAIVLERHTFAHRAASIVDFVGTMRDERPRDLESWPVLDRWLGRRDRLRTRQPASVAADVGPTSSAPR